MKSGNPLQNEIDNSGIKAIEEQDLSTVEVNPNTQNKPSAFPQFTDEAKASRGLEDFTKLKKGIKQALPYAPNLIQEFAPGADLLRQFGILGDIGGEQNFQPSTQENISGGIEKIKQGDKVGGGVDVVTGGLETLGAASDVMMLGAAFSGPLAPVLLGAGVVLKGLTKGGKAILQSKKGKTFFAKIKGNDIQNAVDDSGPVIEVEEILANNPEDVVELGNVDNLPITYTGTSSDIQLDMDKRKSPYKSRLNDVIDTLQNKATGKQFLQTLKNKGNFSQEELKQSGLEDVLNNIGDSTTTKANIQSYMNRNTPEFIVERRVRNPSSEQNVVTDMTFDDVEEIPFSETGRYEGEIESSQEYMYENRTGSPVNDLLVYKLKERDGVTTGPDEANFFQFADQADIKKETIKEIEDNAKKLIEDIPSYAEVTSQTDLFDPDKTKRFLEMGEDEYYEQAIKDKRDKLDADSDTYGNLGSRYFLDADGDVEYEYAARSYEDSPEIIYSDNATGYQIIGDESMGYYSIRNERGEYLETGTETATSLDEARIQAQIDARDRGVLEYEDDIDSEEYAEKYGKTLFHDYKTTLGDDETYEELPYKIKSKISTREPLFDSYQSHFRQANNVGHLRTTLINPSSPQAKNRGIFLVEEFQQDPVNVAKKEDGYKPSKDDIAEIKKIVGNDKIGQNTRGIINITDGDGTLYSFDTDFKDLSSSTGFSYTRMIEGRGTTMTKHPKSDEIMEYLVKNNVNPAGSVSGNIPNKNDGYKFNFRLALSEAVDKNQSHMHYVAGETHALRYGEALPIDSFDRVPNKLLKDEYKTFVRETKEGRYNDDRLRYNTETGDSRAEYVAGRDGTEIAVPFNPDRMSPKYKGKLEAYASNKTEDDFFDDIIMVDINHSQKDRGEVRKHHLMVDKNTDEILGVFYSERNPNVSRPSQQGAGKMFHGGEVTIDDGNVSRITNRKREMGDSFQLAESDYAFQGKRALPDKISDLLTKDELAKLKKDSTEGDYLDAYADVSTEGRVVGGEGKKKLYNKMIKKYGETYLKKIDPKAKIYFELMEDKTGNQIPTYGFEITDKIRKHILTEGIESFNKGGAVIILKDKKINKEIKKPITTPIKKSYGGFVEKNTYDWVYRDG